MQNALFLPHWHINAHSILHVLRGSARIQVVDHNGNNVFDEELREDQVLTIPQNFAVGAQAGNDGFEYISFKTNDHAIVNTLAGRTSVIRALPEDVIANSYQISNGDARNLKYGRQESLLAPSRSESQRRAEA
ncbi:11S seed storage globulin [Quillaja saponaria]|uniref:11S seed storage globulin n=1 Tax=Quillaja saponaria TaxID=32244 RepID=A0AAD7VIK4_QUISA|nr:11S seed storage globulin [Quillaja saponaria]